MNALRIFSILLMIFLISCNKDNECDSPELQFYKAIITENSDKVQELINFGFDVRKKYNNIPMVIYAVGTGNEEIVLIILNSGGDINSYTKGHTETPLTYAINIPDVEMVRFLIDKGANVNYSDNNGMTPLMFAIKLGNLELVSILINAGADINDEDNFNQNIVMYAAQESQYEILKILLNKGANGNFKTYSPLMLSCIFGDVNSLKNQIEKGEKIDGMSVNFITPLMLASMCGHDQIIKILIENGSEINRRCDVRNGNIVKSNASAFDWACSNGKLSSVKALWQYIKDSDKASAFGYACLSNQTLIVRFFLSHEFQPKKDQILEGIISCSYSGFVEVMEELINYAASNSIFQKSYLTREVFIYGTINQQIETIRYALKNNIDVNECFVRLDDCTSLGYSAKKGNYKIAQLLLENGATDQNTCWLGKTALYWVKKGCDEQMIELLEKYMNK